MKKYIRNLFNLWRPFPKVTPTEKGWYIVTVEVKGQQRYVRELYWYPDKQVFWDNIRQSDDDIYNIKRDNNKTSLVVAWKKEPKTYMKGFVKDDNRYYSD